MVKNEKGNLNKNENYRETGQDSYKLLYFYLKINEDS